MILIYKKRKKILKNTVALLLMLILLPCITLASVLSDLATTVQPGEFVELEIDSSSISTCDAMIPPLPELHPQACPKDENGNFIPGPDPRGCPVPVSSSLGNLLEFTDKASWDSIEKEIYIIGTRRPYKAWDQGFVKYSETTNSWVTMEQPPFGFGPHGYDHSTMDVVGRKFYQTQVDFASQVWSMDMDTGIWQQLPSNPIQAGQFAALDYFPELDRMIFFNGLGQPEYVLYNSLANAWESPISLATTPFGAISHFSEYSPSHGVMFFGGGYNWGDTTPDIDEKRRFYMLDENQQTHRLADPPTFLGQFGAGPIQTIDPNTGNLIVFQGELNDGSCPNGQLPIWEYDLITNTWGQTGTQKLSNLYCSMDTVAVPLYEYGVIFIVSVRNQTNCKVYLYKHTPLTPSAPSITSQPLSQTAQEGQSATFSLSVSGSSPLVYQWYRNNEVINGATNSSYTIDSVNIDDDGANFHSTITNNLGNIISETAELTVTLDTTAPIIVSANVKDINSIDIQFSEPIRLASAETITNYQISAGIQVILANLSPDGKTVQLQTDNLDTDIIYTVTINNIQDTSSSANEILPNSTIDILFAAVIDFNAGTLPFNWIPWTLSRWSVVDDNGNNALFLNTTNYSPLSGNRLGEHILSPDSYTDFTLTAEAKTNEPSGNANADYALVFGFVNNENYYYMLFNRTQSNTQLFKVASGNRQELATASNSWLTDDEYHTIGIQVASKDIEIRFDGAIVLQHTDDSPPSGQIGLGSFNDSVFFDDIRITSGVNLFSDLIFSDDFE